MATSPSVFTPVSTCPAGMSFIPPGRVVVGTPDGEGTTQEISFTTGYCLSIHEVTEFEYANNVTLRRNILPDACSPSQSQSQKPKTNVTWDEATQYCATRYRGGRLPTDDEWLYATYPAHGVFAVLWSQTFAPQSCDSIDAKRTGPCVVESMSPNHYGLYDMIGNVMEWTADIFGGIFSELRIIRGGAWNMMDKDLFNPLLAKYFLQDTRRDNLGFRCYAPKNALEQSAETPD